MPLLLISGKGGVEVELESPRLLPPLTSGVRKPAFTPAQVDELRHQSLVLKYLLAGLPVPFHLILPIWRSVARSFGSDNGGIYNRYPSFIGFSQFDYRQMMDPEPGRCRRTDGKKWRCSKDVVPNQKYCERHMHRGRHRSRKHVVASGIGSEHSTSLNSHNTINITNPSVHTDMKSIPSTSNPINLQLATPSSNACSHKVFFEKNLMTVTSMHQTRHIGTAKSKKLFCRNKDSARTAVGGLLSCGGNNGSSRSNNEHIDDNQSGNTKSGQIYCCVRDGAKSTVGGLPSSGDNYSSNNSNGADGNCSCNGRINSRISFKGSSSDDHEDISFVGPVTGCYTKNFLQGCDSCPYIDYCNAPEANVQRCRRTDGKKWRCSRDVVSDQKYCGWHIHSGPKKLMIGAEVNSESVTIAAAAPASHLRVAPPLGIPKKVAGYTNLDTDLSISIKVSLEPTDGGNQSGSPGGDSSSSDATTITDENGSISHLLAVSP